jgi:hypothetical protein
MDLNRPIADIMTPFFFVTDAQYLKARVFVLGNFSA